jgi:lysozyme family protein
MTNIDDLLNALIQEEGGEVNDKDDAGGRTKYGISEVSNPEAWADGDVTISEAKEIFRKKYLVAPGFDKVADSKLQHLLVDFGVNSGPTVAIQKLQLVLGVKVDGQLGPKTLAALSDANVRSVTNQLVAQRVKMLCAICVKTPSQLKFLNGWIDRALEFLV